MSMIIDLAILDSIQGIGITGMVAYFFCEIVYTSTKSKIVSNRVDKTKVGEAQTKAGKNLLRIMVLVVMVIGNLVFF